MKEKPDSSLQLHYIDKVHTALVGTGNRINSVVFAQTLLALLTIALATDVITIDQGFSLEGLTFYISSPLVLISGAVVVGFLLMSQLGLVKHEEKLRNIILRLYDDLNYKDESMADLLANPLESPNVATIILSLYSQTRPSFLYGVLLLSGRVLFFALFLFIPLAAQLIVSYRLILAFGFQWWIFVPITVLLVSTGYTVLFFRS